MWRWEKSRTGGGFSKLCLFQWRFFDCYLLRYTSGNQAPPHVDPVPGKRHYRANLVLRFAQFGGHFRHHGCLLFDRRRFVVFRPDIQEHYVSQVLRGERWVLSIGWALPETKT